MPAVFETPAGKVRIEWTSAGISGVVLQVDEPVVEPGPDAPAFVASACASLKAHLSGMVTDFREVPVDFAGAPPFFSRIWTVLRNISEAGSIMTYGQLARAAGSPGATRAAGSAMRRNPVPIIVPCHRVVASSGPGGYSAAGGLEMKRRLLLIERVRLPEKGASGDRI